ncbi:hypothetical protein Hamer_G010073 [Homarus americanus]|uniref:Uncharacterized protein n=1 Tax=Homarus americanus TaxID=6706 RepID=A0A8J5MN06_HOMAM|nr:hypothetical protein Hamer_G010073 [Homarus americanus]
MIINCGITPEGMPSIKIIEDKEKEVDELMKPIPPWQLVYWVEGENLLRSNWSYSQLALKPRQFHWNMVAMIIGDLGRGTRVCRHQQAFKPVGGRCTGSVPLRAPLTVPMLRGGSPDRGSVEVTPVPWVPSASFILAGVLKLAKRSRFLRNSRKILPSIPSSEDRLPPQTLGTLSSTRMTGGGKMRSSTCACLIHMDLSH